MLTCCHWHCCPNKIQKWHLSQRQLRQGRNNHPSVACFTPLCTMQDLSETDILGPWQRSAGFQRDAAFAKLDVQETLNTCNEDITKLGSVKPQSMSKESNAGDLVAYEAISLSLKSALLTGRAKIRRAYRKDVQSADRNMCQRSNLAPCNKKVSLCSCELQWVQEGPECWHVKPRQCGSPWFKVRNTSVPCSVKFCQIILTCHQLPAHVESSI